MAGFVAYDPVNTPVFWRDSTWRSRSDIEPAVLMYPATASNGVAAPAVHSASVPSGHSAVVSSSTSGCSGARTM